MIRTTIRATGLLVAVLITLSACGGGSGPAGSMTPSPEVVMSVTPPSGTRLPADEVIKVARDATTYLDQGTIQKITVDLDPSGMWTVIFKGMFYEPQRPAPSATDTPRARQRVCSEVKVWVADSTGDASEWTFAPADGCS